MTRNVLIVPVSTEMQVLHYSVYQLVKKKHNKKLLYIGSQY